MKSARSALYLAAGRVLAASVHDDLTVGRGNEPQPQSATFSYTHFKHLKAVRRHGPSHKRHRWHFGGFFVAHHGPGFNANISRLSLTVWQLFNS